jgi:hypothetical protein
VKDAEWLADLLRHGLVRASFIPSPTQRHLRDLTRSRIHLVDERARLTNRLQAVLEDANSQPPSSSPPSSPTCAASGAREILQRLLDGETDARALAEPTAWEAACQAGRARPSGRWSATGPPRVPGTREQLAHLEYLEYLEYLGLP